MKKIAVICIGTLSMTAAAWAASQTESVEDAVKRTNAAVVGAVVKQDVAALNKLLADDLRYIHGDGHLNVNKQEFLAQLGKSIVYKSIEFSDQQIRAEGAFAVLTAKATFQVAVHGSPSVKSSYVTRIFGKQQGQWQLLLNQATPVHVPVAPAGPAKK